MLGEFDFSVLKPSLTFLWTGFLFSAQPHPDRDDRRHRLRDAAGAWAGCPAWGPWPAVATAYVNLMRSIPLVMVILWFFLVIPLITGTADRRRAVGPHHLHRVRGGLLQRDHAGRDPERVPRAGDGGLRARDDLLADMGLVVLPQAFRNMLPILLTQTIILFQDTSLVYAIGAKDLLKAAEIAGKNYNRPVEMYIFAAVIYFALCFTLSTAGETAPEENRRRSLTEPGEAAWP